MPAVYVDSSVLVRVVAHQPRPLVDLAELGDAIASALLEVEVPRAVASLHHAGHLTDQAAASAGADAREFFRRVALIELDAVVRLRAGGPLGAPLRSLDAIHLASALVWREKHPADELIFATHDERLARAAQLHNLRVVGWPET